MKETEQQVSFTQTMKTKSLNLLVGIAPLVASLLFTGCIRDHDRAMGRVLDDRSVAAKVKGALNDSPVYKFPHVLVTAYNGTVQLSGFVYKDEQKTEASEVAKRVPGVVEVINNISMAPTSVGGPGARDAAGVTIGRDTNTPPAAPSNP